jgi:hypothetical protein
MWAGNEKTVSYADQYYCWVTKTEDRAFVRNFYHEFGHLLGRGRRPRCDQMAKKKTEPTDPREMRPVCAWCEASGQEVLLQTIDEARIRKRTIRYAAPNNIALSLSIALAANAKARQFYDGVLSKLASCPKSAHACHYIKHSDIYDYFQQLQISVIFAFTAVESFANIAVPDEFQYERINNKGIREVLSKENIERWCSTTEKVGTILPLVFGMEGPKESSYWADFKRLEELRNDIVHPKTSGKKMEIPTDYLKRFFEVKVFRVVDSARLVINHYCADRPPLAYFPHVIGSKGPVADLTLMQGSLAEHLRPIKDHTKKKT